MDDSHPQKPNKQRPPTNTRAIRKENDRKFLWMVLFTLVVIGGGLIALIYGPAALLTALPILLAGAALISAPYLVLKGIEWLLNRYNGED